MDVQKADVSWKSRLVVCATNDYLDLLTYSPTIQRSSFRLGLAYAACRPDLHVALRNVTQAFIQSDTKLLRPIYMECPKELCGDENNVIMKVNKPVYCLPESPVNWYTTYASHFKKSLEMKSMPQDPRFLYTTMKNPRMIAFFNYKLMTQQSSVQKYFMIGRKKLLKGSTIMVNASCLKIPC